jgi:hypothetical protein
MRPVGSLRSARQSRKATQETDLKYERFAERAGRRLEAVADRLEGDAGRLGINGEASKTTARAQELRVAALLIRDEATAVGREEREPLTQEVAANPPLEAQG